MKYFLLILVFSIAPLSWVEECYEGSQVQISGKIIIVEREALPELDAETGIFSSKGMEKFYLLETNDSVCFATSSGLIDNSETKQIQLVLKDNQKSEFEDLENEQVTLTVEEYYEGLTEHTIRVVVFEGVEVYKNPKVLKLMCDVNKEKYSLDVMRIYFDEDLLVQTSSRVDFWRTMEWGLKVTDDAYIATGFNDSVVFALRKGSLEMFDSVYEEPYKNCREVKYKLWDD